MIPADVFPLRENCDLTDPHQAFLWMLVALPHQEGGPLLMPVSYLRYISKRLWDCGARPVEEPTIRYEPPTGVEPNQFRAPGRWVDVDTPQVQERAVVRVVDNLPGPQQSELFTELYSRLTPKQRADIMRDTAQEVVNNDDPA